MESVILEHYFVKPSTIDKIRGSWLGSQIESYIEWMEVPGYARPTVLRRVPLLFHFAEFAEKRLHRDCFGHCLCRGVRITVVEPTWRSGEDGSIAAQASDIQ
jgi:hypothetical protein